MLQDNAICGFRHPSWNEVLPETILQYLAETAAFTSENKKHTHNSIMLLSVDVEKGYYVCDLLKEAIPADINMEALQSNHL